MSEKIRITETEETPIAPGVKLVRDVTGLDEVPGREDGAQKKITVEKIVTPKD